MFLLTMLNVRKNIPFKKHGLYKDLYFLFSNTCSLVLYNKI